MNKNHLGFAWLAWVALVPTPASAHEANTDSARVVLRDGNVTVDMFLDVEAWIIRRAELDRPLVLAEMTASELESLLNELRNTLTEETQLRVGEDPVSVRLRGFPARRDVLLAAGRNLMSATADGHSQHEQLRIQLEAERAVPGASRVAISFPRSLDRIAVSLVEPQSRVLRGGEWARFDSFSMLSTLGADPDQEWTALEPSGWAEAFMAIGILLALIGLAVLLTRLRRSQTAGLALLLMLCAPGIEACSSDEDVEEESDSAVDDADPDSEIDGSDDESGDTRSYEGEAWADNWFALYLGDELIVEDSVPITTERSFNAESFRFSATPPFVLSFVLQDFKENDSGLEYIGAPNQQMGDGGFIAQIRDDSGELVLVSDNAWRCLTIHTAPLNKDCESSDDPIADCQFETSDEPESWRAADFDDSDWDLARVYSEAEVDPKEGYDLYDWNESAELIWGDDLESDNVILCRAFVD